jgi:hypothetical protein
VAEGELHYLIADLQLKPINVASSLSHPRTGSVLDNFDVATRKGVHERQSTPLDAEKQHAGSTRVSALDRTGTERRPTRRAPGEKQVRAETRTETCSEITEGPR